MKGGLIMVRKSSSRNGPSAANRFARSSSANDDDRQIKLTDVCNVEDLVALLEEAIQVGAAVTIGTTRDLKTVTIAFFVDGQRWPWYIQNQDDWDAMRVATSVDQD